MAASEAPHLTDWITALSTAATFVAVAIGSWMAFIALQAQNRRLLPTIEPEIQGPYANAEIGDYLIVKLWIVNRLDEEIVIDRVRVTEPRKALISRGSVDPARRENGRQAARGSKNIVESNFKIREVGSTFSLGPDRQQPLHKGWLTLFVSPPQGWRSGKLRLDVFVSSNADTIRNKRITIKRYVKAPIVKT
jgi:hypothetical protein